MSNILKMAKIESIKTLKKQGWSNRKIAKELGLHRETVRKYVNLEKAESDSKPANPPAGSAGPPSLCEPFREVIEQSLEKGLSFQRIWQDLKFEHGFEGSYDSVKRFAGRLKSSGELPFRRMECAPGEEAQIDFGSGYYIKTADGKRRKVHIFRFILSFSRKGYSEAVFNQTTENFIQCMENAFHYFGGVCRLQIIDNLRAAVKNPDRFDPELVPMLEHFRKHYDTTIMPTRPYTPRHKGKIENGIGYVKNNALKGRTFESLADLNRHLLDWEDKVADTRIHGTIRKQVKKLFEEEEKQALTPLPRERFPFFHEARRKVHRDGHIELKRAYYSVPVEYMSREVWVRWDSRLVRIFNLRMEQIAVHVKVEPGRFATDTAHIAGEKTSKVEKGAAYNLQRVSHIGPNTARWAEEMLKSKGTPGVRVLIGLLSLANKHSSSRIEKACEIALSYEAFNLRSVRELVKRSEPVQQSFEFVEEHEIIRSLSDYEEIVREAVDKERS